MKILGCSKRSSSRSSTTSRRRSSMVIRLRRSMLLAAVLVCANAVATSSTSGARPNIIFILSDDLGYGDYSISDQVSANSTRIPTPNVARLAKNGMKFSRGYSGQVCAPSRTMLMTGRHLGHTTIRGNDGAYTPLLSTDHTVASVLKKAGYTTGLVGKWGLGNFGTTGYPNAQGFDHFVGQDTQVGCHDWYPPSVCNDTVQHAPLNTKDELVFIECLGPHAKCTWANDLDRTEGIAFIRNSHAQAKPFFLYLSSTTPHAGSLAGTGPKPPLYSAYNPVPYPYNTKFENESSAAGWTDQEKLFASAVWAEDVMVGAVLDELEALSIEKNTVVFFSGDNGPDIPGRLFDDAGFFRGKKRSLHEGGIRQTIVVQWVGTIAANSVSDDFFIFYDLLPTAADLAGVAPAVWEPLTDGLSAVPIFEAARADMTTKLPSTSSSANRFLYYEFCHYGTVDNNNFKQSYDQGWGQAVRFDDHTTKFETQWKAIAVNSNYSNILLYNITEDVSESKPLAGTPLPGSVPALFLLGRTGGASSSAAATYAPVVATALAYATKLFHSQHEENPYWKSSKNASDKCCAHCFSPGGCNAPCKKLGPPTPAPTPSPPISLSALVGNWSANDGGGQDRIFTLAATQDTTTGKTVVTIANVDDATSCWKTGTGGWDPATNTITNVVAMGKSCTRNVIGVVHTKSMRKVIDLDYVYAGEVLVIDWSSSNDWPTWTKSEMVKEYAIVLE